MDKRFKHVLWIGGFVFVLVLFLLSPLFAIQHITVSGCEKFSDKEIIEWAGIQTDMNIWLFNPTKARRKIMENLYIDQVTFEKDLPNTLSITVRERRISGYVEYMQGKYLYIDENGRILEISSYFTEKFPVVGGLKFTRIRLGELLEVDDPAAFKTVVTYARLFQKHQLSDLVSRIDVSDVNNTHILVNHIDFNVGDDKNADEKIRTVKEILQNLPHADVIKGFVDLKEIKNQYYLNILI